MPKKKLEHYIEELSSDNSKIANHAEQLLICAGDRAVAPLIQACQSSDPQVRFRSVWALGKIRNLSAYQTIMDLTKDADERVRYDAILSLGELGDTRAISPLIEWIKEASNDDFYSDPAGRSLAKIGARAVPALIEAVSSANNHTRRIAIYALGQIGNPNSVNFLAKLLDDENEEVRIWAIESLSLTKDKKVIALLEKMLDDPSYNVRNYARFWLSQIT